MKKKKHYLVTLQPSAEFEEIEISAFSAKEAKRKAEKIVKDTPEYYDLEVVEVEELK